MTQFTTDKCNASWDDVPDYLVHFTKTIGDRKSILNIQNILATGEIEARNKFGVGRYYEHCPRAVCLSEASLQQLARLAKYRGRYGLGFTKQFIRSKGGGPLFQVQDERYEAITSLIRAGLNDPNASIWTLVPFIDRVLPSYQYDWDKEWRVPGGLGFTDDVVSFILLPEEEHDAFHTFQSRGHNEGNSPLFKSPLIDHRWAKERVRDTLLNA